MAEMVAAAVAAIGAEVGGTIGASMMMYSVEIAAVATTVAAVGSMRMQQLSAERRAKAAWNAGQRDRYVMVRGALQPRQVVLGRSRVSGPMVFAGSWGGKREHLAFVLPVAGHEVDAIDGICIDDEPVTLDEDGNVTAIQRTEAFAISAATGTFLLTGKSHPGSIQASAWYGGNEVTVATSYGSDTTVINVTGARAGEVGELRITYAPDPCPYVVTDVASKNKWQQLSGSGNVSYTLSSKPDAGSVGAVLNRRGNSPMSIRPVSVVGNVATFNIPGGWTGTGDPTIHIHWQTTTVTSRLRVRRYLGAPGQLADAALMAAMPGQWTANHRGDGVAYIVVEADYDRDAFSGGIPNCSAYVRGLKCFDPRTGLTAWTENPAICARGYAIHKLGGRLRLSHWDDAACIRAANACDTAVTYMLGGRAYPRKLYTCSLVAYTDQRPTDVISDLCGAMGGDWVYANGLMTIAAGAWRPAVVSIDERWLQGAKPVQIQPDKTRSEFFNSITGSFTDEAQNYKTLPFPRIAPAAYITEDGAELPLSGGVSYPAVPFLGQAQYLASVAVRRVRQGLTVKLHCNMRAWRLEKYGNVTLTLQRFGWASKLFEVAEIEFSADGGHLITLQETSPTIWELDADYTAADPAPNTSLPRWNALPEVQNLTATSGTAQLLQQADGSLISRIKVTWDAVQDASVTEGGRIEVRFGPATADESTWATVEVQGGDAVVWLTGVSDLAFYLLKARTVSALSRGKWSPHVLHQVVGKTEPASAVTGFAYSIEDTAVSLRWDQNPDADRGNTYIEMFAGDVPASTWGLAGAVWAWSGDATSYPWPRPAEGTYTVLARHADRSGNLSTTAAKLLISVPVAPGGGTGPVDWADIVNAPDIAALELAAANAEADAQDALQRIAAIDSDSVLSRGEKPGRKQDWVALDSELAGIVASANAYSITTERDAYTVAVDALAVYLVSLVPAWDDAGSDTAIDPAVDRAKWTAAYTTRQALLNAIAAKAKLLASNAQTAADNAAQAASDAANAATVADGKATTANNLLAEWASDNTLSPVEKAQIKIEIDGITEEAASIDAQASAYGITTERTAYIDARNTLLSAVNPLLASLTTSSVIDGVTVRGQFRAFYAARGVVLAKIAAVAGTRASWAGINDVSVITNQVAPNAITAGSTVTTFTLYGGFSTPGGSGITDTFEGPVVVCGAATDEIEIVVSGYHKQGLFYSAPYASVEVWLSYRAAGTSDAYTEVGSRRPFITSLLPAGKLTSIPISASARVVPGAGSWEFQATMFLRCLDASGNFVGYLKDTEAQAVLDHRVIKK